MKTYSKYILSGILLTISIQIFAQQPVQFDTNFELNGHQTITSYSEDNIRIPMSINLLSEGNSPPLYHFSTLSTIGSQVYINSDSKGSMNGYNAILKSSDPDVRISGGVFTIQHNGINDRIGVRSSVDGNGGNKYGINAFATGSGENNYGIYAKAQNGTNNYGIAAFASRGDLNYAGFFGGDVRVEGNMHVEFLENEALPTTDTLGTAGSFIDVDIADSIEVVGFKSVVRSQVPAATAIGGKFLVPSDGIGSRGAVYGLVSGEGGYKYGSTGISEGGGILNTGFFGRANGATENIGVHGIAYGGVTNYAGKFDGDVITSGKTETNKLVVGDNSNTTFSAMQGGTFVVGPDKTPTSTYDTNDENDIIGFAEVTVTFPQAFPSPPSLMITASIEAGQTYDDSFSVTTKSITTTGAILNVYRVDATAAWGQALKVDWFGFSK